LEISLHLYDQKSSVFFETHCISDLKCVASSMIQIQRAQKFKKSRDFYTLLMGVVCHVVVLSVIDICTKFEVCSLTHSKGRKVPNLQTESFREYLGMSLHGISKLYR